MPRCTRLSSIVPHAETVTTDMGKAEARILKMDSGTGRTSRCGWHKLLLVYSQTSLNAESIGACDAVHDTREFVASWWC